MLFTKIIIKNFNVLRFERELYNYVLLKWLVNYYPLKGWTTWPPGSLFVRWLPLKPVGLVGLCVQACVSVRSRSDETGVAPAEIGWELGGNGWTARIRDWWGELGGRGWVRAAEQVEEEDEDDDGELPHGSPVLQASLRSWRPPSPSALHERCFSASLTAGTPPSSSTTSFVFLLLFSHCSIYVGSFMAASVNSLS